MLNMGNLSPALRAYRARIVLLLSLLVVQGPAAAQSASSTPAPNRVHAQLRFAPKGQRFPVPFEMIRNLAVFQAKLNGKDVWAVLDNRASTSLIDLGFAQDQRLPLGPVISPLKTPTGTLERRLVSNVKLQIPGQFELTAPLLPATDLSFVKKLLGRPIALVIGQEYFSKLAFLIRPSRGSFQVGPSGTVKVPPTAAVIPLTSDRPHVDVRIGDKVLNLTIDLGFDDAIGLTPEAWARLGLEKLPASFTKGANAQGDVYDVKIVTLPAVTIGPVTAANVRAGVRPTSAADGDGLLGMGLLRRFDFALDVKARKLWLIDPKAKQAAPQPATSAN
jgi:hypothetical protein